MRPKKNGGETRARNPDKKKGALPGGGRKRCQRDASAHCPSCSRVTARIQGKSVFLRFVRASGTEDLPARYVLVDLEAHFYTLWEGGWSRTGRWDYYT